MEESRSLNSKRVSHSFWHFVKSASDLENRYENPGDGKKKEEVQDVGDALEQMSIKKKKAGPSSVGTKAKETIQPPEIILMNLVLTLLYGDVSNNHENARSGCPIKTAGKVKELMNTTVPYTKAQDLISDLSTVKQSPHTQLVSWLSPECSAFALATDDTKIPGFDDSVHQFVVVRQNQKIHSAFEDLMKKSDGMSRMVWHGTSLCNVRSILRNGFRRSPGGYVWSAEEAIVSYDYSFQYPQHDVYNPTWAASPYNGWGALLGCEVAGGGDYFPYGDYTARIMPNPSSIIVRYVLLLPPSENTPRGTGRCPNRTEVEPTMLATFTKLRSEQVAQK